MRRSDLPGTAGSLVRALAAIAALLALTTEARATPMTESGAAFQHVGYGNGAVVRYALAADAQGRIYAGFTNESGANATVLRYDPTLYAGTPIALAAFGPTLHDADGITFSGGAILVSNVDVGVTRIPVLGNGSAGAATTFSSANVGDLYGSPIAVRSLDGHLFAGHGYHSQSSTYAFIDEYDASGTHVAQRAAAITSQTITYDASRDVFYHSTFNGPGSPSQIYAFNALTHSDTLVAQVDGSIDGGLAYDPISGLIFAGTAYGSTGGRVYTIDPVTHEVVLFAHGFADAMGIIRDGVNGSLFFLDSNNLYVLPRTEVDAIVGTVPEPTSLALGAVALAAGLARRAPRLPRPTRS